jgi:hypothetical protein
VFYFPLEPRKPICGFDRSSGFFLSKKIPLRVVACLSEDKCYNKGHITALKTNLSLLSQVEGFTSNNEADNINQILPHFDP